MQFYHFTGGIKIYFLDFSLKKFHSNLCGLNIVDCTKGFESPLVHVYGFQDELV